MSKAISVDISDASVEIVDLRHLFSTSSIKGIGRELLPSGIVVDGIIQDMDALLGHVQTAAKNAKPHAITLGTMHCAIPESKVYTHVFSFPRDLGKKEVEQAIAIQFTEYFPFELEQVYYDWDVVQETEQTRMVLVGACERVYVDQLRELAKKLGAKVGSVDIESVSTARAIVPVPDEQEAVMMVDMGARVTSISMFDRHALQMTYALDVGGHTMNDAFVKQLEMEFDAADALKKELSLTATTQEHKKAFDIMESLLHPVVQEMKRVQGFYEGNYRKTVKEVIICGGVSLTDGMEQYLSEKTGMQVTHGNALSFVKNSDNISLSKEESLLFANVIGLSLGQLNRQFKNARFNFLEKISK